jgi:hypothetical protein
MAVIFDQRGRPIDQDNPFPTTVSGSKAQLGSERFTSLATAQSFTAPSGAVMARVYCEAGEVAVRDDGTPATATTGVLIGAGTFADVWAPAAGSIIEVSAGSVARVVYY